MSRSAAMMMSCFGIEVVRQHAGRVARCACDAHHARLLEAVLGHDATRNQCDFVAAL